MFYDRQEQLEELWQELEQLRAKNDALKADNATLLAEREFDGGAAVAHSNGDLKPRGAAADVSVPAAAGELEAARRRVAELEVGSMAGCILHLFSCMPTSLPVATDIYIYILSHISYCIVCIIASQELRWGK